MAKLSVHLLVAFLLALASTAACSSGVCSATEQQACTDTHTRCVDACGNGTRPGANGLPETDPNHSSCVNKCNDDQCSCLTSCGSTCTR